MAIDHAALAIEIDGDLRALPVMTAERVRAIRRTYSQRLRTAPPETVLALAFDLLAMLPDPAAEGWHAGIPFLRRFVAYELVAQHRAALAHLGIVELERLGQGIASWEAVDTFSLYLAGPVWREHQVQDRDIFRWAASADRWWRRAALVSTVPLNSVARGGKGDAERTLAVCDLLADDRDDMVIKALSWALRELVKRDPDAVRAFLDERQGMLAARVVREVQNKLTTGLKSPRRSDP